MSSSVPEDRWLESVEGETPSWRAAAASTESDVTSSASCAARLLDARATSWAEPPGVEAAVMLTVADELYTAADALARRYTTMPTNNVLATIAYRARHMAETRSMSVPEPLRDWWRLLLRGRSTELRGPG